MRPLLKWFKALLWLVFGLLCLAAGLVFGVWLSFKYGIPYVVAHSWLLPPR